MSFAELVARLRYLFRREQRADDLSEEMRLHIELRAQRNREQGMTPDDARREAQLRFGNVARIHEDAREVWIAAWTDQLWQDLKFGARWLKRSPGFTAVVVSTLAVGIGINTAMFSVVNAVLLQPLPYPSPEKLIWIANTHPGCTVDCFNSRADYLVWSAAAPSIESMAAFGNLDLSLFDGKGSTTERIAFTGGDFWRLTGAHAELGRLPGSGEADTLVLSWALFERQFGTSRDVIGRRVTIDGHSFEIAGVLSRDFRFLFPQELYTGDELRDIDAYAPLPRGAETPGDAMRPDPQLGPGPAWVRVFGRLKPHATVEQARTEITAIHNRLNQQYPSLFRKKTIHVLPVAERIVGASRLALIILLGAVGFVLLIACANVANLLMARASVRRKEIAIRAALGAGKWRVVRQFVAESLLLAAMGGACGLLLARAALFAVIHWGEQSVPRVADTTIDARVLAFTALLTLLTALLFGVFPAAALFRDNLEEVMREDGKAASASRGRQRLRMALVSAEIALASVLLTGAGLMLRSFWRMNSYPQGFTPERIVVMKLSLGGGNYFRNWVRQDVYIRQMVERIEGMAGVEAVGIDCGALNQPVRVGASTEKQVVALRAVSPGYFRALGVGLTRGRWPDPDEVLESAIVNQSLAWQARSAGHEVTGDRVEGSFFRGTISGVVGDFRDRQLDSQPAPQVYIPYQRSPIIGSVRVIIRTSGEPGAIIPVIREVVSEIDHDVPIQRLQTLEQELFESIAARRFHMYLLESFAGAALLLALVGMYGVIAFIVAQRTREIGIRMALGARQQDIVGMVVGNGLRIMAVGLLAGLAASLVLTRLMASMIYDLSSTDPVTFAAVSVTLGVTALLACCRPAYQAAAVDPLIALRRE